MLNIAKSPLRFRLVVVLVMVLLSGAMASAQDTYLSMQGTFTTTPFPSLNLTLDFPEFAAKNTVYRTYAYDGGTTFIGDSIPAGGIDSYIEVYDPSNTRLGWNDDRSGGSRDSLLWYNGTNPSPNTYLPPLGQGAHRFLLEPWDTEPESMGNGSWALDVTRFGNLSLTSIVSQSSTLKSLKFGSDNAAGAVVKTSGTLTVVGPIEVGAGGVLHAQNGAIRSQGLTILAGGRVDLHTRALIVDYTGSANPIETIRGYLQDGYANGAWDGDGIMSTNAAPPPAGAVMGLGYGDNADLNRTMWDGLSTPDDAIIIQLTYAGDANLDGLVDGGDLLRLATSWQSAGYWMAGDFNYDGLVNQGDLALLATNWMAGHPGGLTAPSLAEALTNAGLDPTAVPEPSAALLIFAGTLLMARRRSAVCRRG